MPCKIDISDISKTKDLGAHDSWDCLEGNAKPIVWEKERKDPNRRHSLHRRCDSLSLPCGIVGWNFPLRQAVSFRAFPFGVRDSTLGNAPPSWNAPPKGFVLKWFCAHLSGKKVFTEKFKLKLGGSTGNVQNQMQIERLQMQMVLFKDLFWKENYRWTGYG